MSEAIKCEKCAHCYMDMDMDFICGHPDAGAFGKFLRVATAKDGHCGPERPKFKQHPKRVGSG